jgi:hypothetical protein
VIRPLSSLAIMVAAGVVAVSARGWPAVVVLAVTLAGMVVSATTFALESHSGPDGGWWPQHGVLVSLTAALGSAAGHLLVGWV